MSNRFGMIFLFFGDIRTVFDRQRRRKLPIQQEPPSPNPCLQLKNKKIKKKQDKVNYAVSEREDRVTDVTTLTRMTGLTGMYWAVLGCT